MVHEHVSYDGAKKVKGRKRHLAVDTLGLSVLALVTQASVPEREGCKQLLKRIHKMGSCVSRVHTVWADGGYDGLPFFMWAIDSLRWVILGVLRPTDYSPAIGINYGGFFKHPLSKALKATSTKVSDAQGWVDLIHTHSVLTQDISLG